MIQQLNQRFDDHQQANQRLDSRYEVQDRILRDTQNMLERVVDRLVILEQQFTELSDQVESATSSSSGTIVDSRLVPLEQQFADLAVAAPSSSASSDGILIVTGASAVPLNTGSTSSATSSAVPDDSPN